MNITTREDLIDISQISVTLEIKRLEYKACLTKITVYYSIEQQPKLLQP